MKKLFNLKMLEGGLVVEHINNFNTIVNQLFLVGIKFDDEICALIMLASLPNSWESMIETITNSIGNAKLQFIDIRNTILAEEVHRKNFDEASTLNSALNIENRGEEF